VQCASEHISSNLFLSNHVQKEIVGRFIAWNSAACEEGKYSQELVSVCLSELLPTETDRLLS